MGIASSRPLATTDDVRNGQSLGRAAVDAEGKWGHAAAAKVVMPGGSRSWQALRRCQGAPGALLAK